MKPPAMEYMDPYPISSGEEDARWIVFNPTTKIGIKRQPSRARSVFLSARNSILERELSAFKKMPRAHSAIVIDPSHRKRIKANRIRKAKVLDPYLLEIDPRFKRLSLVKKSRIRKKLKHLNAKEIYGADEINIKSALAPR